MRRIPSVAERMSSERLKYRSKAIPSPVFCLAAGSAEGRITLRLPTPLALEPGCEADPGAELGVTARSCSGSATAYARAGAGSARGIDGRLGTRDRRTHAPRRWNPAPMTYKV